MRSKLLQFRLLQIRFCSRCLLRLGKIAPCARILQWMRQFFPTRALLHWLTGFHRPFGSLSEASSAVARFNGQGHANPDNARMHLDLGAKPRPSDHPALSHIRSVLPDIHRVFDLGGNVGNLYYCYRREVDFAAPLEWRVFDIGEMLTLGQELAAARGETALRFTDSLGSAEGVDLFIASGSLHYFAEPLPRMLSEMAGKPKYVLVNRTPLSDSRAVATVQDAGVFRVACQLYNRQEILRGFEEAGYEMVDSWRVEELSVQIPCYPDLSVPAYSGMFLRRKGLQGGS